MAMIYNDSKNAIGLPWHGLPARELGVARASCPWDCAKHGQDARATQTGGAARRHTGESPVPLEPHGLAARATQSVIGFKFVLSVFMWTLIVTPLSALEWERGKVELKGEFGTTFPAIEFPFSNNSDKPVTILAVRPSCQCVTAQVEKKTYAPGEKGVLLAKFDATGLTGQITRTISVETDEPGKKSNVLAIVADITEPIALTPRLLYWKVSDPPAAKAVEIQINLPKGLKITQAIANQDGFKIELATVEAGRSYRLTVTPNDTKNPRLAVIALKTSDVVPAGAGVTIFAQVR